MGETLIDTNIFSDILLDHPSFAEGSSKAISKCADKGRIGINQVVYAELVYFFKSIESLDQFLASRKIARFEMPWDAAYLAGIVHQEYRKAGGNRNSPLSDFFIGAHASVAGYSLLTRDTKQYKTYFPKLEIISPAAQEK